MPFLPVYLPYQTDVTGLYLQRQTGFGIYAPVLQNFRARLRPKTPFLRLITIQAVATASGTLCFLFMCYMQHNAFTFLPLKAIQRTPIF
ncbi:hypothetical protein C7N43_21235 [Sphingobacteriales bacterium UPWRP_1]|nr:hypothetical protein BVG80_16110 [Sphingobacteriales bacterium TSM_CSM]PSJ74998.1 hypothetical protein C7N43_21235 [Sphingobacteriales bacterium UPWRP_1]